jgi:hypothetical protein
VEQHRPESSYFVAEGGRRTGYFFFDLKDPTTIPAVVEPFFTKLDASIDLSPAMNLEEMRTGVERVFQKK